MPRPKSNDPKRALTIRLPASIIERLGGDAKARAKVVAFVMARMKPPDTSRAKVTNPGRPKIPYGSLLKKK
jgi:hypothetical protein